MPEQYLIKVDPGLTIHMMAQEWTGSLAALDKNQDTLIDRDEFGSNAALVQVLSDSGFFLKPETQGLHMRQFMDEFPLKGSCDANPKTIRDRMAFFSHQDDISIFSTLDQLLLGAYGTALSYREVQQHGDATWGTLNGLGYEVVGNYKIDEEGNVVPLAPSDLAPFAVTTPFKADDSVVLDGSFNQEQLIATLNTFFPEHDTPYVFRVKGRFTGDTRVVRNQDSQVPQAWKKVVQNQAVFSFTETPATLMILRLPPALGHHIVHTNTGPNPDYHFHILIEDAAGTPRGGGHVIKLHTIQTPTVEVDRTCGAIHLYLAKSTPL